MGACLPETLQKRNKPVMLSLKTHILCCFSFLIILLAPISTTSNFWGSWFDLSSKLIDISDETVLYLLIILGRTKYKMNSLKRTNCSRKSLKIAGSLCWKSTTYLFMVSNTFEKKLHWKRIFLQMLIASSWFFFSHLIHLL